MPLDKTEPSADVMSEEIEAILVGMKADQFKRDMNTKGVQVLKTFLRSFIVELRNNLETATEENLRYYQGKIQAYRDVVTLEETIVNYLNERIQEDG